MRFSSPLALGLCDAVPASKGPIDAILWHARVLIIESGLSQPPFAPAAYAPLRNVKKIIQRELDVEGRLLPEAGGFIIELRKDRPHERKNFTCAHEIGHTFFYEAVPSIKYRTLTAREAHYDPEEEMLCNIAAAELLMPSTVFSKIAADYSAIPQSLQEIAELFETSLTSTVVQLLRLQVWNSTIVLWSCEDGELKAIWMARPRHGLAHYPYLKIENERSSSIYHSYCTGEATTSNEWLCLNGGFKQWTAHSIRLKNTKKVLTCISSPKTRSPNITPKCHTSTISLPLNYDCECDGTGWLWIERNSNQYVMRCRATTHRPRG